MVFIIEQPLFMLSIQYSDINMQQQQQKQQQQKQQQHHTKRFTWSMDEKWHDKIWYITIEISKIVILFVHPMFQRY